MGRRLVSPCVYSVVVPLGVPLHGGLPRGAAWVSSYGGPFRGVAWSHGGPPRGAARVFGLVVPLWGPPDCMVVPHWGTSWLSPLGGSLGVSRIWQCSLTNCAALGYFCGLGNIC